MSESPNQFEALGEDRYRLVVPDCSAILEVDRLRRERNQLICELSVTCELPGSLTVDGVLSVAEMNLSSQRARVDRARYLDARARALRRSTSAPSHGLKRTTFLTWTGSSFLGDTRASSSATAARRRAISLCTTLAGSLPKA